MFIINFCLNMFRAPLCQYSGEQRPCYCIWCVVLVLLDVVVSGWDRDLNLQQVLSCCLLLIVITRILLKNKHGDGTGDYQIMHTSYQKFRILDSSLVIYWTADWTTRGIQGGYLARIKDSLFRSA
jgi:hypothetical protein